MVKLLILVALVVVLYRIVVELLGLFGGKKSRIISRVLTPQDFKAVAYLISKRKERFKLDVTSESILLTERTGFCMTDSYILRAGEK